MCGLLTLTMSQVAATSNVPENAATVTGTVVDANSGEGLIGTSVSVVGTTTGTFTNAEGKFSLEVTAFPVDLLVSYTGYASQTVTVNDANPVTIKLEEGLSLDQVVVTGTRGKPRTILNSAVPIDNINAADLRVSGQKSVDQMINYKIPSYNSSNQAISDATAHIDPSELRNLGPSRTLVLINGKRKNQSSQVYLNDTPGRGEVGTDMKSIPAAAIERIEVLRDGAAAQYGSDAVAGVINIILKERPNGGEITLEGGVTTEGDGETYGADVNYGIAVGDNGFLNLTGEYYYQDITDRAGEFANEVGDPLFGIPLGSDPVLDDYFTNYPDLNMTYGQPEISKVAGMANFGMSYDEGKGKVYSTVGYTFRQGKSFAFYRTSYWRDTDWGLLTPAGQTYIGYQPTFESDINDITAILGNTYKFGEWNSDISVAYGSNSIDYTVDNSLNRTLEAASPTSFEPGGYTFSNLVGNLDVSRTFDNISVAVGTEVRQERYEARAGEANSYSPAPGTDSFPGLTPDNAADEDRTNIGVYGSIDVDVTETFLAGGAVRFENYSDFGSNFSWKVNLRQLISGNKGAIRASVSTGFRAPSLHQIYLSNVQTTAGANGLIQEGTFSNVSDITRNVLGVPQLDAETSFNITVGATYKVNDNFSASVDYYNIRVNDRVLFSDQILATNFTGTSLGDQLATAGVDAFKFFINAVDTRTQGLDVVLNYENISLGEPDQKLTLLFALNINETELDGTVDAPDAFGNVSIFGDLPSRLLTSARPNTKASLGIKVNLGKFSAHLNNTYFGKVNSPVSDQEFAGKVITDLILGYDVSNQFNVLITANNLFNVYPDKVDGALDPFGYRLQYPWRVNQFGFMGTILKIGAAYKFQ